MRLSLSVSRGNRRLLWVMLGVLACGLASLRPLSAQEDAPSVNSPATYKQTKSIECCARSEGFKLEDFCAARDGRVLALVSPVVPTAAANASDAPEEEEAELEEAPARDQDKVKSEVRVFDAEGELTEQWKLEFHGQAINVGPDGSVYVGGAGRMAKYDLQGKQLAQSDAPQTGVLKDPEKLRDAGAAQLTQEKGMYQQALQSMQENVKVLEKQAAAQKKQVGGRAASDSQLRMFQSQVGAYERHLQRLEKKTVEDAIQDVIASRMAINAIAIGDQDIYVACRAEKGYGYAIWKTDLKFENPKQIVANLVGCCGQMDIQARGDEVWVAENAKHRVVKYDRHGKELMTFGKRDREGAGEGFGGCCNPMNLCFDKSGDLLVSESNGVVKHFTKDCKYVGVVGVADVRPGCKNSAVGITADGQRVFYIDIQNSKVIVLSRGAGKQASAR